MASRSMIIGIFLVVLVAMVAAQEPTPIPYPVSVTASPSSTPTVEPTGFGCSSDLECLKSFGSEYSCVSGVCRQVKAKQVVESVAEVGTEVQNLQQLQVETQQQNAQGISDLKTDIATTQSAVSELNTGLAVLQQSTQEDIQRIEELLKEQQAAERQRRVMYFILIAVVVALAVTAIIFAKSKERKKQQELVRYIERALKRGATFLALQERLTGLGWNKEDISMARQTLVAQRSTARPSPAAVPSSPMAPKTTVSASGPSPLPEGAPNPRKMLAIMMIGVVSLFVFFLILRQAGVLSGHAIAFGDIESAKDLRTFSVEALDTALQDNPFVPLVDTVNICVQIHSDYGDISYLIQKKENGQLITTAAKQHCEDDPTSDFAVKFMNPEAFAQLSEKVNCASVKAAHAKELDRLTRGMYVLPSRYIQEGFTLNPNEDPTPFCDALLECLTDDELALIGVDCS